MIKIVFFQKFHGKILKYPRRPIFLKFLKLLFSVYSHGSAELCKHMSLQGFHASDQKNQLQGYQLNMAVFFWHLVKSNACVRLCTVAYTGRVTF